MPRRQALEMDEPIIKVRELRTNSDGLSDAQRTQLAVISKHEIYLAEFSDKMLAMDPSARLKDRTYTHYTKLHAALLRELDLLGEIEDAEMQGLWDKCFLNLPLEHQVFGHDFIAHILENK